MSNNSKKHVWVKLILLSLLTLLTLLTFFLLCLCFFESNNVSPESSEHTTANQNLEQKFRKGLDKWNHKADDEHDKVIKNIYLSHSLAELYFLKPFISKREYDIKEKDIRGGMSESVPRYIDPNLLLFMV